MEYNEGLERRIIELVAVDRTDIPISSLSSKLKKLKPVIGQEIALEGPRYKGERVYAKVEDKDKMKARGMKEAIAEFSEEFPRYGAILQGKIEEKRAVREQHLYFGVNEGSKLTSEDYVSVLTTLGFTETQARNLYPALVNVSRNISRKRNEERSVMIG